MPPWPSGAAETSGVVPVTSGAAENVSSARPPAGHAGSGWPFVPWIASRRNVLAWSDSSALHCAHAAITPWLGVHASDGVKLKSGTAAIACAKEPHPGIAIPLPPRRATYAEAPPVIE